MTATKTRKIKGTVTSEKYRPTRDRELWYVKLDGGKTQACFYAQGGLLKGKRVMYCLPAVGGDKILSGVLEKWLGQIVVQKTTEGWMCEEDKVRLAAHKAPGITPSWYNKRPGMKSRFADPETCEITRENVKFIQRASELAGLPDPHLMKTIFGWIQQQMLYDLLMYHEPIDLGFAWMIAIPYRPNWKDALSKEVDYNLETLRKSRASTYRKLTSLTLAGVRSVGKNEQSEGTSYQGFHWTIEIIPKPMWHRAVAKVELEIRKQGGEAHLRNWARIVWELRPRIQQAMEEYTQACKLPVGKVARNTPKDRELRPYAGSELVKRNSADDPSPIVFGGGIPPVWNPEGEHLPAAHLQTVASGPTTPLDMGIPKTKNLVTVIPVASDVLDGFPSGDAARPKSVPSTETPVVSQPDPIQAPQSSGPVPDVDDFDPYPWADESPEAAEEPPAGDEAK